MNSLLIPELIESNTKEKILQIIDKSNLPRCMSIIIKTNRLKNNDKMKEVAEIE